MRTWASDTAFDYRRFTFETADAFIAFHFDGATRAAFRKCGVPAMQADFFRYCALFVSGGIYVDADTENGGGLPQFIAKCERAMLMNRQAKVANDFLYFRNAHDPLLKVIISQAVENIEKRVSNNVWLVTGPGIMTQLYQDPSRADLFAGISIRPARDVRKHVKFRHDLAYKSGSDDWRKALDKDASSIFSDN